MMQSQKRRQKPLKNKPVGAMPRDQTPQRKGVEEALDATSPGGASVELVTCPQPRRAYPGTLNEENGAESSPGSEEVNHELREICSGKSNLFFDIDGTPDCRPMSAVSTCAGPTPCPTSPSATPFPDRSWSTSPDYGAAMAHHGLSTPQREKDQEVSTGGVPAQGRKVFVGGIPQDMSQDDLLAIFSEHASIKKAWLQKYRAGTSSSHPPNHHRGFGFVIFNDASTVDRLLGDSFSRYLVLRDGRRLEVKRAVSSSEIVHEASPDKRAQKAFAEEAGRRSPIPQVLAVAPPPPCSTPPPVMVPVSWQAGSPTMMQPMVATPTYTAMPCAPVVSNFSSMPAHPGVVLSPSHGDAAQVQCAGAAAQMAAPLPVVPAFPQGAPAAGPQQYAFVATPNGNAAQMWVPQGFVPMPAAPAAQMGQGGIACAPTSPPPPPTAPPGWGTLVAAGGSDMMMMTSPSLVQAPEHLPLQQPQRQQPQHQQQQHPNLQTYQMQAMPEFYYD